MQNPTRLLVGLAFAFLCGCGGGGIGDFLGVGAGDTPAGGPPPPGPGNGEVMSANELDWAMQVHSLTNQERQQAGAPPLAWDDPATQVAFDHCLYQQAQGAISHAGAGNTQPWDRLTNAGIGWSSAAENVAVGQPSPAAVVNAWVNSAGHYANMLSQANTRIGIGCQEGPGGIYAGPWWTQLFYSP